jgi:hypothetical protein
VTGVQTCALPIYLALKKRLDDKCSLENWFIDFKDHTDVLNFALEYSPVLIKKPTYHGTVGDIEIYDCERENLSIDLTVN